MFNVDITTFLAWRYLTAGQNSGFLRVVTRLTLLGIFIATFTLTIALMITLGFEKQIKDTLQGLSSDVVVMPTDQGLLDDGLVYNLSILKEANIIRDFSSVLINQLIMQNACDGYSAVAFKGVEPKSYVNVTRIKSKIRHQKYITNDMVSSLLSNGYVIIGAGLASQLGIREGQLFSVLVPKVGRWKVSLIKKQLRVGLIMSVGFEDYDSGLIIGSKDVYKELYENDGETSLLMLQVEDKSLDSSFCSKCFSKIKMFFIDTKEQVVSRLKNMLPNYKVLFWKELSPNLLASMSIEKIVAIIVVSLIILVGMINIVSLIYITIQIKRKDIAILLAMGATPSQLRTVFIKMGMFLSLMATVFAQGCAYVVGLLMQKYEIVRLPDIYYIQTVPVDLSFELFIFVFLFVNIVTYLAVRIPANMAANIVVAEVLKQ